MILPEQIWTYCLSVIALACIPGIAVSALTSQTARYGGQAGFNMAIGICLARISKICVVLTCLPLFVQFIEAGYTWIKLAGALYLIWMGYRVLSKPPKISQSAARRTNPFRQILAGYLISWSNPKALLFATLILPRFTDASALVWQQIILLGGVWASLSMFVEFAYITFAMRLFSLPATSHRSFHSMPGLALIAAGLWLGFGEKF